MIYHAHDIRSEVGRPDLTQAVLVLRYLLPPGEELAEGAEMIEDRRGASSTYAHQVPLDMVL